MEALYKTGIYLFLECSAISYSKLNISSIKSDLKSLYHY